MTPQEHNRLISIFFHVQGGLQVLAGLFLAIIYGGMGTMFLASARREEEQFIGGIFVALGFGLGLFVLAFAALDFYAAFKIGRMQPIGRTLGIIVSILSLMSFPLGTALGVYGLWFFFGDQGKFLYGLADAPRMNYQPPPPPNSWQ